MFYNYNMNVFKDRLKEIREIRMKEFEAENKEPAGPLKRGRRPNDFSQENLSKALFTDKQTVMKMERGDKEPTLEEAIKFASCLTAILNICSDGATPGRGSPPTFRRPQGYRLPPPIH